MEVKIMRQRGEGYVGAIIAMVIAGLIIYAIIFYGPSIWRGIREGIGGWGTTPLEDVVRNSRAYENQEVSTVGMVIGGYFKIAEIFDDEGNTMKLINVQRIYRTLDKYKVVGKVVFIPAGFFYDNYPFLLDTWAIEVKEIIKI